MVLVSKKPDKEKRKDPQVRFGNFARERGAVKKKKKRNNTPPTLALGHSSGSGSFGGEDGSGGVGFGPVARSGFVMERDGVLTLLCPHALQVNSLSSHVGPRG